MNTKTIETAELPEPEPKPMLVQRKEQQIEWKPLGIPTRVSFAGTSYFDVRTALMRAFKSEFPIRLSRDHLPVLHGMICAAGEGKTPYVLLYNALNKFGDIELRDV